MPKHPSNPIDSFFDTVENVLDQASSLAPIEDADDQGVQWHAVKLHALADASGRVDTERSLLIWHAFQNGHALCGKHQDRIQSDRLKEQTGTFAMGCIRCMLAIRKLYNRIILERSRDDE